MQRTRLAGWVTLGARDKDLGWNASERRLPGRRRQKCDHCCTQLPPAGSQASRETFPNVSANIRPGAAARERGKAGAGEAYCPASLSCHTVVLMVQRQIWSRGDGFVVCVEVSGEV